jgi:NADH-quinone oxidoreductase subunit N
LSDAQRQITYFLTLLTLAGCFLITACADPVNEIEPFSDMFVTDPMASVLKLCIYASVAAVLVYSQLYLRSRDLFRGEFFVLVLFEMLGMLIMVSGSSMLTLYLGLELLSLSLYALIALQRDSTQATEAAMKYFVLGALSSGLLLYGASLIYGFAGSTHFADIGRATTGAAGTGVVFGLVFLICGLAFKVSAAPFHMWTPDVYEGSPTPVTALLAAAPKIAAMVLFARVLTQAFPHAITQWSQVITAIALISVTVGALGGLVQKNLKRLLAYSSIANIGYALLGLAAGSQNGMQAMLMFMVLYVIDVTGFFACLLALSRNGKPMETLSSLSGLVRERPALAIAITILSLSVLGLPPLSGFWAKFFVFRAAVSTPGLEGAAVYGLVMSVAAAFYYLRVIKTMWFDPPEGATDAPPFDARLIALGAAAFAFPLVIPALAILEALAATAAKAFGLA